MKLLLPPFFISAVLTFLATVSAHAVTITGETTTDFDAQTNANVVDGVSSNVIGQTIPGWETAIEAAASGTTGVIWNSGSPIAPDASGPEHVLSSSDSIDLSFAGGTKTLTLDPDISLKVTAFSSATALSGTKSIAGTSGSAIAYSFTFSLSGGGLQPDEQVSQFGLVYLGRSGAVGEITITANLFSGGSVELTPAPTDFGKLNNNSEDTLFHFSAPAGDYFTGFSYASTEGRENPFDEFGVMTSIISSGAGGKYASWAIANNIPGEPANGDFDKDGLTNLMEYALGSNPTAPSPPAGTLEGGLLSFTKGADARINGDIDYVIETSTSLGTWVPQITHTAPDPSTSISYTLPVGLPRIFGRLKVLPRL